MPVSTGPGFIMITAGGMVGGMYVNEEDALTSAQSNIPGDGETRAIIPCTLVTYTPDPEEMP